MHGTKFLSFPFAIAIVVLVSIHGGETAVVVNDDNNRILRRKRNCKPTLVLWDAQKDVQLGILKDGDDIDQCLAGSFSIEVVASCARSVSMWLQTSSGANLLEATEYSEPYMLGSDDGLGHVHPVKHLDQPGSYILKTRLSTGRESTFAFTVRECCQSDTTLQLWDADQNKRVGELKHKGEIDSCLAGSFSIEVVNKCLDNVSMRLRDASGTIIKEENQDNVPFMLGSDDENGNIFAVDALSVPGDYSLRVKLGKGLQSTFSFTVRECCQSDTTLQLWDADQNKPLGELKNKGAIDSCLADAFSIEVVNTCLDDVSMLMRDTSGTKVKDAYQASRPFMLGSDDGNGDVYPVDALSIPGDYGLKVKLGKGLFSTFAFTVLECCQSDTTLQLWDADQNKPLGELKDEDVIDSCLAGTFSIEVVNTCLDDVSMRLKRGSTTVMDAYQAKVPYMLGSDDGHGDVSPVHGLSEPGDYSLKVKIAPGQFIMTRFTVAECACESDTTFQLWDASKDERLYELNEGGEIDLCLADSFSIEVVNTCVDQVSMWLLTAEGANLKDVHEHNVPYMLGSDDGLGDVYAVSQLNEPGEYMLKAQLSTDEWLNKNFTVVECATVCEADTTLRLWDASKDERLGELSNGDEIDSCLADSFSIEVVSTCADQVSMWLMAATGATLRDAHKSHVPYMLGSDNGTGNHVDPVPELSGAGEYMLKVELPTGELITYSFSVKSCLTPRNVCKATTTLQLWDAEINERIGEIKDGDEIDLCLAPSFSIEVVNHCIDHVSMSLLTASGDKIRDSHESIVPYMLGSDDGDGTTVNPVPELSTAGGYMLKVELPTGESLTFSFTLVECPSPTPIGIYGDPHVKGWNSQIFDFHGACDLVMLHNPDFDGGIGMDIHVRTKIVDDWSGITSAAVRIGEDIFEVVDGAVAAAEEDAASTRTYLNGKANADIPTEFAGYSIHYRQTQDSQDELLRVYTIDLGNDVGIVIKSFMNLVDVRIRCGPALDIRAGTKEHFSGSVGLLGSFATMEKTARDGNTVFDDDDAIGFGKEWQVRDTDRRLFHAVEGPQYPQHCRMPEPSSEQLVGRRKTEIASDRISEYEASVACEKVKDDVDRQLCISDVMAMNSYAITLMY